MKSLQNAPYAPTQDPIEVVYEDADLAVIIKPSNLLTVPGRGPEKQDCAETRLRAGGRAFVRAAHRLDQDTSGLVIFGLSPQGHRAANMMFEARGVAKRYAALCWTNADKLPENDVNYADNGVGIERQNANNMRNTWLIDLPLCLDWPNRPRHHVNLTQGKPSQTGVSVQACLPNDPADTIRVDLTPITGRSHQLRVHLSHTHFPICGDPLYGKKDDGFDRLCLHATHLCFDHPLTGERLSFDSPAPF